MFASNWLITVLIAGSLIVWRDLALRLRRRQPLLDQNKELRATFYSASELAVVYMALLWLVFHLFPQLTPVDNKPQKPIGLHTVVQGAAVNFVLCLVISTILASGRRASRFGLSVSNLGDQCRIGVKFFLAAVVLMAISMAATMPIRSPDRQHSLLKLLADSPDVVTITVIGVTAILSAPLLEELLFRVILQGWLTTLIPAPLAIFIVAVSFSLVHGWQDGLALLPLAFVLGYVFDRRHSYVSVVMIHALFNATMLTLQLLNPQMP